MAGSVRSCCVPKCGGSRADNLVLHSFPDPEKYAERFLLWVKAVGSSLSGLEHTFILKNRRVCHNHFEKRYLTWTRRLTLDAVPTLCMPGTQEVERSVMRDITNIETPTSNFDSTAASTSSGVPPGIILEEQSTPVGVDLTKQPTKSIQKGMLYMKEKKALVEMLKKATKKKENYATRLKRALKLTENITFQKTIKKFTTLAAIFMTMQFREIGKKKMGRKYTQKEKIMALSIYKQGPKCYRMLSKAFVLPSPLTLSRLISRADLRAGINEKLFSVMKKKIKNMKVDDKLCVLLFDEISIAPHFQYNQRKDKISGFVTNGTTTQNKIADHALVFMVRGILKNYKQPVAYTFCSGSTKKEELSMLLTTVIKKLHSAGLRVLATVCDQGASNVSCINYLIKETKAKYLRENKEMKHNIFQVDGNEVIPLYDTPHLIKGIRNNLLDKDLICTIEGNIKIAKWEHFVLLHHKNPAYSGIKLIKNLTEDHVNPEKCKMKVKYATQIFSQKVGSTMGFLAENNILPKECQQTADVALFFDELFDSMNGSYENSRQRSGKPLLRSVTPSSNHKIVWAKAKKVLTTMRFLKNGKETIVPSISNWLHNLNNIEYLRDVLKNGYKIKSFWMRHLNQDPLENFFGAIRSHGSRNVNPSPAAFEIAFASLLISNLTGMHSPGSNCEEDACKSMFKSMKDLFKTSRKNDTSLDIDLSYLQNNIFVDFDEKTKDPCVLAQLDYVTGYLLRKTKIKVFRNCISCKEIFYNKNKDSKYLKAREYNKNKQYLEYPSKDLTKMFSELQDVLMWVLKNNTKDENIKNFAKTILYTEINTNFITCDNHRKSNIEYMFDLGCRFFIFNWCKDTNKILNGLSVDAVAGDFVQNLARVYATKRRKKK